MLKNFFKLNEPFETFAEDAFENHLKTSKSFCNILYEPKVLKKKKIEDVDFDNISFSKTLIENVTFIRCHFKNSLFIGTTFRSVEFHDCTFDNCNFFKSEFEKVYARPHQFKNAITKKEHSNIGVHLYHKLRENYYNESQREFKNEAEFMFLRWDRVNEFRRSIKRGDRFYSYLTRYFLSSLNEYLFGYGYRVRRLAFTTLSVVCFLVFLNYRFSDQLFSADRNTSIIETIYFTLTTMATLGSSGYTPDTEIGYSFVIGNVLIGASLFSATISAIFKKVIR